MKSCATCCLLGQGERRSENMQQVWHLYTTTTLLPGTSKDSGCISIVFFDLKMKQIYHRVAELVSQVQRCDKHVATQHVITPALLQRGKKSAFFFSIFSWKLYSDAFQRDSVGSSAAAGTQRHQRGPSLPPLLPLLCPCCVSATRESATIFPLSLPQQAAVFSP